MNENNKKIYDLIIIIVCIVIAIVGIAYQVNETKNAPGLFEPYANVESEGLNE